MVCDFAFHMEQVAVVVYGVCRRFDVAGTKAYGVPVPLDELAEPHIVILEAYRAFRFAEGLRVDEQIFVAVMAGRDACPYEDDVVVFESVAA